MAEGRQLEYLGDWGGGQRGGWRRRGWGRGYLGKEEKMRGVCMISLQRGD